LTTALWEELRITDRTTQRIYMTRKIPKAPPPA